VAVIKLTIYVANLTNAMSLFDEIQIWRSLDGIAGTYEEITDDGIQPAEMTGTETAPFTLNGLTLSLKVNAGTEQTVTFVTADPINVDDVVDILNDELTDLTASEDTGAIKLSSTLTGTGASIEITGGTALTELGFTLDQLAQGRDDRLTLTAGVSTYQHDDQGGDTDAYDQGHAVSGRAGWSAICREACHLLQRPGPADADRRFFGRGPAGHCGDGPGRLCGDDAGQGVDR
jgi:hypothetical protein